MKDEEMAEPIRQPIANPRTYELLVRQSKKLGRVATKTFHDLRHVLYREIPMPSRDQLLNGLSLVPKIRAT
jgi:hypothetical protein